MKSMKKKCFSLQIRSICMAVNGFRRIFTLLYESPAEKTGGRTLQLCLPDVRLR